LEVLANIERLNFTILSIPNNLIIRAAEYKAQYSLSYADCFALASAVEHKAILVTGDPEFKKVEHLVDIVWIL
jgi:ribonuclease VapC